MAKKFHSRKFLNKKTGMAAIECSGAYTAWSMDGDVNITDCSRKVSLDFYAMSPKEAKEKLDKLDLLLSEIAKLRVYYADSIPEFEKLYKEALDKRKLRELRNKDKYPVETVSLDEVLSGD